MPPLGIWAKLREFGSAQKMSWFANPSVGGVHPEMTPVLSNWVSSERSVEPGSKR